ncbi:MAG: MBL fold metallo-hydrolase [Clostridia bacterium]|nr:MBL fold metallo-hydrolase [Clostridia bacterium]
MKITCLIENTASDKRFAAEHGLSLFIETGNKKILFDMGQTENFAINADKLGINLSDVDYAILSHGHYDHGGGLSKFLSINKKAPVYLNQKAFEPHYNGTEKYIGLDISVCGNDRLIFADEYAQILPNIFLHSCNGKKTVIDTDSGGLTNFINNQFIPDDFAHEQYLMIEENGKKILFSGCSHKGIINICEWFRPDVLIGGFHYSKYPLDGKLGFYCEKLNDYDIEFYTCHCTGTEQFEFMKKSVKKLSYISSGDVIEI